MITGFRGGLATSVAVAVILAALRVVLPEKVCLAFLAGVVLGLASWAAVTLRARALTTPREQRGLAAAILTPLAAVLYYLLVAGLIWAATAYLRAQIIWLVVGYLVSLAASALLTLRRRP